MRILIMGDTHGKVDLNKLSPERVKELDLTSDDVIIHCGDIGVPWNVEDLEPLNYWRSLPCEVVINLGNHENFDWIQKQPIIEKFGGKGYQMGENMFAPLIGEILEIEGKTFWFYPGGYSIDYLFRKKGKTIYPQELPLATESETAIQNLVNHGKVDVIITHDGPRSFIVEEFGYNIKDVPDSYLNFMGYERGERVHPGFVLDNLRDRTELYDFWYFGHHHKDIEVKNIRCLMHQMILWDLETDQKTIV